MRRSALSLGGWLAAVCSVASVAWACSSGDTNPFGNGSRRERGGSGGTDPSSGGTSGTSAGTDSGGSVTGGTSGTSTGGDATGGMTTGGGVNDGGAAAEAGDDTGGTTTGGTATGGTAGAGMGGSGGAGAGAGGAGAGSGGAGAGAGGAGAGAGGAGMSGSGGMPGECKVNTDCDDYAFCKKASCDAESGVCTEVGPECRGNLAVFGAVCGCNGVTYWNQCVIAHEGENMAAVGECSGNNRPSCTREIGPVGCPQVGQMVCYRPVEMCGDSGMDGFCWAMPTECPPNEPQTERYCGGTGGAARCIGLCEVLSEDNSFRRDAPACD